MERDEQLSYLILFCSMLAASRHRRPLGPALRRTPFQGGAHRLAQILANDTHTTKTPTAESELPSAANSAGTADRGSPLLAPAEYRDPQKKVRIETRRVHLRCPSCAQKQAFDLDSGQLSQLRARGHFEAMCSFCAAGSLWQPVAPEELQEPDLTEAARVLLVGSDAATLRLVGEMLGAWDARVDVACSGREACTQIAARPYDLMVAEFRLKDMGAAEFFEETRGLIPADRIVLLAEESWSTMQVFLDATGCLYCRKPVSFKDFYEQVEGGLGKRRTGEPDSEPIVI